MSYILDALQRAEAERERGHVPGLKSQLVPPARAERPTASGFRPWHALPVLAALALGAWWWFASPDTAPVPAADTVSATPSTPVLTPPATTPPAPPPLASPSEPVAAAAQPILAPPRPPPVPARAAAPAAEPPASSPTAAVPAPAPAPTTEPIAAPKAAAPVANTPAAAPTGAAVPGFGELSPEARAQLPAVNISGSTYSKNPALRMLIANGKVVYEGQDIAPGLRLETIGARSAVLNHQGLRYSIGY